MGGTRKTKIIGDTRRKALSELESQSKFKFRVSNDMVIPVEDQKENEDESANGLVAELSFMGNYSEPNLCIPLDPMLKNLHFEAPENENEDQDNNLKNGFQTLPPTEQSKSEINGYRTI